MYNEMYRSMTTFRVVINSTDVGFKGASKSAAETLPDKCVSDADKRAWFDFFVNYGTHHISGVSFGGKATMRTFLDSTVKQDNEFKESQWSENLGAKFGKNIGIEMDNWNDDKEEKYQKFETYTFETDYHSYGGDQSLNMNYDAWLGSVKENPAPFKTTLSSHHSLFAKYGKDYDSAYKAYFEICPHTDSGGICNGFGNCNYDDMSNPKCSCLPGSYLDSDNGNCYKECPVTSNGETCYGKGTCHHGQCVCERYDNGFGYTGAACDEKCGHQTTHLQPGQPLSLLTDKEKPIAYDKTEMTCWCKEKFAPYDDYEKIYASELWKEDDYWGSTYACTNPNFEFCEYDWWDTVYGCEIVVGYTCSLPTGTCPTQVIEVPLTTEVTKI
jgi:hypothetical protein